MKIEFNHMTASALEFAMVMLKHWAFRYHFNNEPKLESIEEEDDNYFTFDFGIIIISFHLADGGDQTYGVNSVNLKSREKDNETNWDSEMLWVIYDSYLWSDTIEIINDDEEYDITDTYT